MRAALKPVPRPIATLLALLLVAGLLVAVQFVAAPHAAKAHADVTTGTAGLFTPLSGRLMDTRNGTGGYTTPMPAGTWRSLQVEGTIGIPSSGVSAVAVTLTVVSPTAQGIAKVMPYNSTVQPIAALIYGSGTSSTESGSAISAVSADGKIQVSTGTAVDMLVDVQGYYTTGNGITAAGGYVPIAPTRTVDTRVGTGAPKAKLAGGSTTVIQAGGVAGVPADASAVFVSFTVLNYSTSAQYLIAWDGSAPRPSTSLNYAASATTAIGATMDLNSAGKFSVYVSAGSIDLFVDVIGYYTASSPDGSGAFTPAATRVYDSRQSPNTILAGNSVRTVSVGGIAGVPLAGSGISAVALSMDVIHSGSSAGNMNLWAADQTEPGTSSMNYLPGAQRTNFIIVRLGADGRIKLHNSGTDTVHVVLDVEGWFANVGLPVTNGQTRTQQNLTLQAAPSGGGTWVSYKYRVGTTAAFVAVPPGDAGVSSWPVAKSGGVFPAATWNMTTTLGASAPDELVQVQACYGSSASDPNPVCSVPADINYVRSSFGDSAATAQVGPGSVALQTGNYQVSASDVAVPSYQGSLSLSRTFATLSPAGERSDASGVFGPGWVASLPTGDAGAADLTVTDSSAAGYLVFTGTDGSASTYEASTDPAAYPISFVGVDDAAADGTTVTKVDAATITMLDSDGTTTTWKKTGSVWAVDSVVGSSSGSTIRYDRDGSGRVTRIVGETPSGVSCATNPDTTQGCRTLTLTYTSGTPSRLQTVTFNAWNPATAAMAHIDVAQYDYNGNNRLFHAWDPRISPALKTTYTYDGNGRLATITPPGLAAWTLNYDSNGRLANVSRYDPALAQSAVTTIAYSVPTTGGSAPIDFATAATWGQTSDLPVYAAAVFGPDHQPAGNPNSSDWPYADLHYLDVNGRETNTAAYGAGAWQYGATGYDGDGNAVTVLTPGNRAQALSPTADTDPAAAAATTTAGRAALLSTITTYDALNPDRVTDTYSPAHPVLLSTGSSPIDARSHTHTTYDEGSPVDANNLAVPGGLPTTTVSTAYNLATNTDLSTDQVITHSSYSAVAVGGSKTGWDLRAATSTTTVGAANGGGDLTTNTRYNDAGQTVQSWLPGSNGSDARATSTTYYTATGTGSCVSAALVGLVCSTGPTAQPGTGNPLPITTTTYNVYDEPLVTTETAGGTIRTTTTTYGLDGRGQTSAIAVSPVAAGGSPLPVVTTNYDPSTGLPTTITAAGQTLATGYDTLGRVTDYTDATNNHATTSYDLSSRPVTVNDGKGTYTYTYDSATEHRGVITAEDIGVGSTPGTFTATYTPDGGLAALTYPNGLVATSSYDNTANPTELNYSKSGSTLLDFKQTPDAQGRTRTQTSPASSQLFGYDTAGRLIQTNDTTNAVGATPATCTTRTYTLDADSNRQALNSYPASSGTSCSTSTTPTSTTGTFDGADRLINTGYSYDTLGRTVAVPASDAQGSGSHTGTSGSLSLSYYSNDLVTSQSQGGVTMNFSLDPMQNRYATISTGATSRTNRYINGSDSPAWTSDNAGHWTRNLSTAAGELVAIQDETGSVSLQLTDLHGAVVATCPDTSTGTPQISYAESTEFGVPRDPASSPNTYAFLGTKLRSSDSLGGLVLMGVRLYSPYRGRFLTADPIEGGSANPYDYSNQDPINQEDSSGCLPCSRYQRYQIWTKIYTGASGPWNSGGSTQIIGVLIFTISKRLGGPITFLTDASYRSRKVWWTVATCVYGRRSYGIGITVESQLRIKIGRWGLRYYQTFPWWVHTNTLMRPDFPYR